MIKNVLQEIVCDECKEVLINVRPYEKNLVLENCGWKIIKNPPMCKGMDKHICPKCVDKLKNKKLIKSIKIHIDKGEGYDECKYIEIQSKDISKEFFKDVETIFGITCDTLKKLIENFEFESDKAKKERFIW